MPRVLALFRLKATPLWEHIGGFQELNVAEGALITSDRMAIGVCPIVLLLGSWLIYSGSCGMLRSQQFPLIKESLLWANRGVPAFVTKESSWW